MKISLIFCRADKIGVSKSAERRSGNKLRAELRGSAKTDTVTVKFMSAGLESLSTLFIRDCTQYF